MVELLSRHNGLAAIWIGVPSDNHEFTFGRPPLVSCRRDSCT